MLFSGIEDWTVLSHLGSLEMFGDITARYGIFALVLLSLVPQAQGIVFRQRPLVSDLMLRLGWLSELLMTVLRIMVGLFGKAEIRETTS
jgi:hypothetical protein